MATGSSPPFAAADRQDSLPHQIRPLSPCGSWTAENHPIPQLPSVATKSGAEFSSYRKIPGELLYYEVTGAKPTVHD